MQSDFQADLPLRDVVFNTLRQAILTGELKPGERLMEPHLADRLGVSRTPVREAIRRFKFHGGVSAAKPLGELIAQAAAERFSGGFDTVTWVPVSAKRLRQRGYDQSRLLAENACGLWGVEPEPLLRKVRDNPAQSSLDSAEGWGTWDLFGGVLIADLAKHSHLDEAQGSIERLQSQLRQFKTELADVTIYADMQVNVDGFLRFADYFFDGLFADWAVLDKISQSQSQVQRTKGQIESVLSRLDSMLNAVEQEQAQVRNQLDTLVLNTQC